MTFSGKPKAPAKRAGAFGLPLNVSRLAPVVPPRHFRFNQQQSIPPSESAMTTSPITITVGHSPDPDDAFMFYALAHDKIDTGPYRFRHELQDIETLNRRALRGELEVTAISLHAYAFLHDKY